MDHTNEHAYEAFKLGPIKQMRCYFLDNCKKITISTFQSGNIIITGARTIEQINCCYNFIMNVLCKHMKLVMKKEIQIKTKV